MTAPLRLDRRLVELTGCPRAQAQRWIEGGWVTVDGVVVEQPQRMVTTEEVLLNTEERVDQTPPATMLLHKPDGVAPADLPQLISDETHSLLDASGVRTLQRHFHGQRFLAAPLAGDESGLVVVTQDPRVQRFMQQRLADLEQEYLVEVRGDILPYGLQRLASGLQFGGRPIPRCRVSWQNEERLRFAIKPVLPGQLQHMCAEVGLEVVQVRRLRIGRVALGRIAPGQWRYLGPEERF